VTIGTDIALEWDSTAGAASVVVEANDLKSDDGLATALYQSLFLDRRAEPGDVLPEGTTDRRGWWADAHPVVAGDVVGSRLWLLERSVNTPDVLDRAVTYAREAVQWLLDDRVSERVDVTAEFLTAPALGLALVVTVHRPGVDPARFRFNRTWAAEENRQ